MLKEIAFVELKSKEEIQTFPILAQISAYAPILIALCKAVLLIPFLGKKVKSRIQQALEWLTLITLL